MWRSVMGITGWRHTRIQKAKGRRQNSELSPPRRIRSLNAELRRIQKSELEGSPPRRMKQAFWILYFIRHGGLEFVCSLKFVICYFVSFNKNLQKTMALF